MSSGQFHFIAFGTILFLLTGCSAKKPNDQPPADQKNKPAPAMQVTGFVARTRSLSENLEVPGSLLPFESTQIQPEISGRIVKLNITEGSFVKKGDLLVKLFDEDLQAALKKLKVQLAISQKTSDRQRELLKINGISQQDFDLSELNVNNIKADIESTEVSISKTEIRAPFNGKIGLRNISLGAYVTPTSMITSISEVDKLKLEFTVPEKYGEIMKQGRSINFAVSGNRTKFAAKVFATESNVDANTRTLRVRALVTDHHAALIPGAFAQVSLQLDQNDKAVVIPTQAIIPQARSKSVVLYNHGTAKFQVVTTGIRDSSYVQIIDGVKAGDTVIITGLMSLQPNNKIALQKVQ